MILKTLRIVNYRNYREQDFEFSNHFNFIHGDNGHGKTNILEAISFITFAKSFIGSSEADCLKTGETFFTIKGELISDSDSISDVMMTYEQEKKRSYTVNKDKIQSISSDIFNRFPVVFLSPHSLNITYGSPGERRKFFDIIISQTSLVYLDDLKMLSKLVKQKNSLLKSYFEPASNKKQIRDLLLSYNEKLISVSTSVIQRRLSFLDEFKKYFDENFRMLVEDGSIGSIDYSSEYLGEAISQNEISSGIERALNDKFEDEIRRGLTLIGPHRDDYEFKLEKSSEVFDLKNHASQGEHKTFIVALKLSEYKFILGKKEKSPVLLLDDILSELDIGRVGNIISHLKEFGQIFLTTTEKRFENEIRGFYKEEEIKSFRVFNGEALPG